MAQVQLEAIALGRSGDKGEASNVGIIARSDEAYAWLVEHLTAGLVRSLIPGIAVGAIDRYEAPNLRALNFILHASLGGGGTASLLTDAQGKTHAQALLRAQLEIPDEVLASVSNP